MSCSPLLTSIYFICFLTTWIIVDKFKPMHLCVDFHDGPSKEYLIFFLYYVNQRRGSQFFFPVTAAVGDYTTIINLAYSLLLKTSKSAFQPNLMTQYDS